MKARPDPLLLFLNVAQTVAAPFLLLKKWRRYRARGDAYEWDMARWNPKPLPPDASGKPHLVLVAMGFAETRLAARLTALLREQYPDLRITWAVRNLDAARQGGAVPPDQAVVPLPFDYYLPVARWHQNVAPDIVVFIERFAFVNLVRGLHNRGVTVAAVAARTRDHRGGRSRWVAFYERWLWGAFSLICLRSQEERLKLGPNVPASTATEVTGSLKFWPELPSMSEAQAASLMDWLQQAGERPILAAGSTQPGDEEWIFEAFAPLRGEKQAVLLLAPRHVDRADEVEAKVTALGWKVARRSRGELGNENVDVLLLDTLGELTQAYGASQAAFIGGTIRGTGHNVLEPISHGVPVFFGPKRGTFAAEQALTEEAGVGFRVSSPEELTQGWKWILESAELRVDLSQRALAFNREGGAAWRHTVEAISRLVMEKNK